MTEASCRNMEDFDDDDPTEELKILRVGSSEPEEDSPVAENVSAANQPYEDEDLDDELGEAHEKIAYLSAELSTRTEKMQSIQRELDDLQEFSGFLAKEVNSGKDTISSVTDELITVRTQQNDLSEQLRRREKEIDALQNKIARKDAAIGEFAAQVGRASAVEREEPVDSQPDNDGDQFGNTSAHASSGRVRMLVGKEANNAIAFPVLPGGITLGTGIDNDVQLQDAFVSYRHASITETGAGCVLKDLGSSNGTWVNQRRIKWQVLRDGDLIDIGPLRFEFVDKPVEVTETKAEDERAEDEAEK